MKQKHLVMVYRDSHLMFETIHIEGAKEALSNDNVQIHAFSECAIGDCLTKLQELESDPNNATVIKIAGVYDNLGTYADDVILELRGFNIQSPVIVFTSDSSIDEEFCRLNNAQVISKNT